MGSVLVYNREYMLQGILVKPISFSDNQQTTFCINIVYICKYFFRSCVHKNNTYFHALTPF